MNVKCMLIPGSNIFEDYNDMHYVLQHIKNMESYFQKCSTYNDGKEEIIFQPFENGAVYYIHAFQKNENGEIVSNKMALLTIKNAGVEKPEIKYIITQSSPYSSDYDLKLLQSAVTRRNREEEMKTIANLGKRIDVDVYALGDTRNKSMRVRTILGIEKLKKKSIYQKSINNSMSIINETLAKYSNQDEILKEQKQSSSINNVSVHTTQLVTKITPEQAIYIDTMLKVHNKEIDVDALDKLNKEKSIGDRLEEIPLHYQMELIKMWNGEQTFDETRRKINSYIGTDMQKPSYVFTSDQQVVDLNAENHSFSLDDNILEETNSGKSRQ